MMLRWTTSTLVQMEHIHDYIFQENPDAASKTIQCIVQAAEMLAQHPGLGKPGRRNGTREFVKAPFVLVYSVIDQFVTIEAVFHGNQRW